MRCHQTSRPYVAERTLRQILHLAEHRDDNPLDLTDTERLTHASKEAIEGSLIKPRPETLVRMAHSLHAACRTEDCSRGAPTDTGDLDEISASLMLGMGLNPLAVAWSARAGEGVEVMMDDVMMAEIDIWTDAADDTCTTRVHLADGVSWLSSGGLALLDLDLPDSLACALAGKPLSSVFSHHVLDGMNLTIDRVEDREVDGDDCTVVVVREPRRAMDAEDLLKVSMPD